MDTILQIFNQIRECQSLMETKLETNFQRRYQMMILKKFLIISFKTKGWTKGKSFLSPALT